MTWALSVPLLPEESLSSWLVRAALRQGCDPLSLTGLFGQHGVYGRGTLIGKYPSQECAISECLGDIFR